MGRELIPVSFAFVCVSTNFDQNFCCYLLFCNHSLDESDARKIWKIINSSCGRIPKPNFIPDKLLGPNSESVTGHLNVANALNSFFTDIGPNLAKQIHPVEKSALSFLSNSSKPKGAFDLSPVCEDVVYSKLISLNVRKSSGIDLIPAKLLKICAKVITTPFTHIINLSINSGTVPDNMKIAKVIPIYKNKGSQTQCGNYRPISILPILSKILENIVNEQMEKFLQDNNILSSKQYGFMKKKCTKDALIEFSNKTMLSLNNGNCILGVFLDFSKAFDTINHSILISKLNIIIFHPTP